MVNVLFFEVKDQQWHNLYPVTIPFTCNGFAIDTNETGTKNNNEY
jgi:hypothetical protein